MNEANDWLDTVFGAQNGNYGGAIWDQYILQTTFGAGTPNDHNNDLPNINDESGVNPNTDARDWVEYQLVYWNAQTGQADWDTDIVCQNETCQKAKEWHWTNVRPPPECDFGDECASKALLESLATWIGISEKCTSSARLPLRLPLMPLAIASYTRELAWHW